MTLHISEISSESQHRSITLSQTFLFLLGLIWTISLTIEPVSAQADSVLQVAKTDDFTITGSGSSDNWSRAGWVELTQRTNLESEDHKRTFVKILYSETGIYFHFRCEDERVSATIQSHFEELWREDVVEVFLWPNEGEPVYFEYELSPLNYELPILVSKTDDDQSHWIPFGYSYKDKRKTRHKTSAAGGELKSGAAITEWQAEFFIPFELLHPMKNIYPESGSRWRANMYRVDYDNRSTNWTWQPVRTNFHDIYSYGTFVFE